MTNQRASSRSRRSIDAATLDLLSTLRRAGVPYRLSTRELAARCLVTAGAVTQRVDRAKGAGLVERLAPAPGSRTVLVELTPTGHSEVERAVGLLLGHEQGLVEVLSPGEQEELARLLAVLLGSLRERAHGRAPSGSQQTG